MADDESLQLVKHITVIIATIIGNTVHRHSYKCTKQNTFNRNYEIHATYNKTSNILTTNVREANVSPSFLIEISH